MSSSAAIPIPLAWSSPFVRWQGALAETSSIDLAVDVTKRALAARDFPASEATAVILGWTVPQPQIFYGAPTVAHRIGAEHTSGPMISQACATGAVSVQTAAARVQTGIDRLGLVITTDRTSNGPLLTYPLASAPGGAPHLEHWVMDSFEHDPVGGTAMIATAERVAADAGITREQLDDVTLLRYEQYRSSLADDRAFQRRYMVPIELPSRRGEPTVIDADFGVFPTTAEGLAALRPVVPNGLVTFGSQTHPADGTAGLVVTSVDRARDLAAGEGIATILGTGGARVEPGQMPKAPVPAAQAALDAAGLTFADVDVVTAHDPFAVNDVWFARQTGIELERVNQRGSSLIFGHPQAPTGTRLIVELLHTLAERGGGVGLFTGCAAGDTGAAVVVRVED
ncbi:thiolase family protein [Nitriliruptor alkaliphilus]|uniref:thiolase family protein n=1 Tax=Nitriliruptor alkaliphilus TaxID=427918 RepID=UPI000697198E|nr:thiolase family protein [Nitriliruptor alkaliphilus]